MGPVEAQPAYSGAPFGLVSLASVVIARDPEDTGQPDWPWPWDITTNRHISISGFVACPGGTLSAEAPSSGDYALNILGGLLEDRLGIVGTGSGGYELSIAWDEGFTGVHPPHFPSLEMWKMFSWQQDPDYGGSDIDDNLF
jgi:hypothetical protein